MASKFTTRTIRPYGRPAPVRRDPDRDPRPRAWYVLARAAAELPCAHWEAERIQAAGAVLPYGHAPEDLREARAAVRALALERALDDTHALGLERALDALDGWAAGLAGYGHGALWPADFSNCAALQDFRDRVGAAAGGRDPHSALGQAVGRWLAGVDATGRAFLSGRWGCRRPPGCGRAWGLDAVVAAYRGLPAGSRCAPELDTLVRPVVIRAVSEADAEAAFAGRMMGWDRMDDSGATEYVRVCSLEDAVRELAGELPAQLSLCRRPAVAPAPPGPPVWDPAAGTLAYAGHVWPVAQHARRVRPVLGAFQEAGWPGEVTVIAGPTPKLLRQRTHTESG